MVEFGFALSGFLIFTVGLIDGGRAFYQYNALASAARFGARWGSVVGGTCRDRGQGLARSDWCNRLPTTLTSTTPYSDFWGTVGNGNTPLQTPITSVATFLTPSCVDAGGNPVLSYYYTASSFTGSTSTTIVGAVVQRFDSDSSTISTILGRATPGFDHSKLRVCIYLSGDAWTGSKWIPKQATTIGVSLYYPFSPAGPLLGGKTFTLLANSQYSIE
jgi:Flp pilus assembly protein TadG